MSSPGTLTQLYRAILRVHRLKLPPPMRALGDRHVRSEFTSHINGKTTAEQWRLFVTEWMQYHRMLSGEHTEGDQQPDVIGLMTPEQQSKMATLYEEAQKLRGSMIDDAFPGLKQGGR